MEWTGYNIKPLFLKYLLRHSRISATRLTNSRTCGYSSSGEIYDEARTILSALIKEGIKSGDFKGQSSAHGIRPDRHF